MQSPESIDLGTPPCCNGDIWPLRFSLNQSSLSSFLEVSTPLRNRLTKFYASSFVFCCRGLFTALQQGEGDTGLRRPTYTGHNVLRFSGTAMLMCNKLPEECLADYENMLMSPRTSKDSLRSTKSMGDNNS